MAIVQSKNQAWQLRPGLVCEEEVVWEDALQDWVVDEANHDSSSSSNTAAEGTLAAGEGSGGVAAGLAAMAGGGVSVADIEEYLEGQQGSQGLRLMCRAMTGAKAFLMLCLVLVFDIFMALVGPAIHFTLVQPFLVWVAQGVARLWDAANTLESRRLVYLGVCLGAGGVFTGVGAGRLRRQWLAEQKGLSREYRRAAARWSACSVLLLLLVLLTCAIAVTATPDVLLGLQVLTGSITAWEFSHIHAGCFRGSSPM